MSHWRRLLTLAATLAGLVLLVPAPASAYLDPGLGSYFLQSLIAVLLAGLFTLRAFWSRIRDFLRSRLVKKPRDG